MSNGYNYDGKDRKTMGIILTAFAALVCVSAIALGVVALKNNKAEHGGQAKDVVDLNHVKKETSKEDETSIFQTTEKETTTAQETQTETKVNKKNIRETTAPKQTTQETSKESPKPVQEETTSMQPVNPVAAKVSNYKFAEHAKIAWPIKGDILLDYSMDNTIYFPTLDSYKCNPAIVIQGENGASVQAGVKGVVEEVSTGDEVGNYVVLAVGDGYELTYGQLKDIKVQVGDEISETSVIGVVAEPTRYYQNEGSNLYFEVTKDGQPVDPLEYLQD